MSMDTKVGISIKGVKLVLVFFSRISTTMNFVEEKPGADQGFLERDLVRPSQGGGGGGGGGTCSLVPLK